MFFFLIVAVLFGFDIMTAFFGTLFIFASRPAHLFCSKHVGCSDAIHVARTIHSIQIPHLSFTQLL